MYFYLVVMCYSNSGIASSAHSSCFAITVRIVVAPLANCTTSPHIEALEVPAAVDSGTDVVIEVTTTFDATHFSSNSDLWMQCLFQAVVPEP